MLCCSRCLPAAADLLLKKLTLQLEHSHNPGLWVPLLITCRYHAIDNIGNEACLGGVRGECVLPAL